MARCPECGEKLVLPATLARWDRISVVHHGASWRS